MPSLRDRVRNGWNAFRNRDPTFGLVTEIDGEVPWYKSYINTTRPDRVRLRGGVERSIIAAIYNRIAIDVSSIRMEHVRTDQNGKYLETIDSGLNKIFNLEANLDQSSREFMRDVVLSMFDEGVIAICPIDTTTNPYLGTYEIQTLRTGRITQWEPTRVFVEVYNDRLGIREEIPFRKDLVAIIENPLYQVMNEWNSTLQRLIRKLNILDAVDEQSGSGKLDLIIQLPYVVKTKQKEEQAEKRRRLIEDQLSGSKYGIAYTDGTERITQLNRPAENNLMSQIQYLTSMLFSQLGMTEAVFMGTAEEREMLNYWSRTIEPILSAIRDESKRKFLTKTARSQNQTMMFFKGAFMLVPAEQLADLADKFTRNEILSPNEVRQELGYKPSTDPAADELRNRNLNAGAEQTPPMAPNAADQEKGDTTE